MKSFSIREANPEDLPSLVDIHVTTWNETYGGDGPKPSRQLREQQWNRKFELKENNWFCYVVENNSGNVVGFVTGSVYDGDLPYDGELSKLYVLRNYQRAGLGTKLVSAAVRQFKNMGINSMVLFSDAANPNLQFYEALGGQRLYDDNGNFHGGYGWNDLKTLL